MRFLKKIGLGILFNMGALYVTLSLIDDVSYEGGWAFFLITAIVIGSLNTFIKPVIKFLSLPFIFVTGGLFMILINAGILWITVYLIQLFDITGIDFRVEGTVTFVLAALVFGLTNWFEHWLLKRTR